MLVVFTGNSGVGKTTSQNYLCRKNNFTPFSFASRLKDVVSVMFDLPRELLEGDTKESREWRDTPNDGLNSTKKLREDVVSKLYPNKAPDHKITPLDMLKYFGTNIIRKSMYDEVWVDFLESPIKKLLFEGKNVCISDLRTEAEYNFVRALGGKVISIEADVRGVLENNCEHHTENEWTKFVVDASIKNDPNGNFNSFDQLYAEIDKILKTLFVHPCMKVV